MYNYSETCVGIPLTNTKADPQFLRKVTKIIEELELAEYDDIGEVWDEIKDSTSDPVVLELFALLRDNPDKIKLVSGYSGDGDQPYWIEYTTDVTMPVADVCSMATSSATLVAVTEVVREFESFCTQNMSSELLSELSDYIGLAFNAVTS